MNKKFSVDVEMEERWIPHFISMLKRMEKLGSIGSSEIVSIYSDGDGDFRPKFKINHDSEIQIVEPAKKINSHSMYDAG